MLKLANTRAAAAMVASISADLCAADMILFLHIVPMMAALALRPHAPEDEYAARLRRLDFALMMVWWAYLYVLIVIPWQYIVANPPA